MTDIENRLEMLERTVRWWRRLTTGFALAIVVVIFSGAARVEPPATPTRTAEFDVVTTRVLRVQSQFGQPVVHITADASGNGLFVLSTNQDKPANLLKVDPHSHGSIEIVADRKARLFVAGADEQGQGRLSVNTREGQSVIQLLAARRGGQAVKILAENGKTALPIKIDRPVDMTSMDPATRATP